MKQFPIDSPFFEVDFKKLALLLLPTFLRQPRIFAFLTAMISSISKLHEDFALKRKEYRQRLLANGQVCYLRKLLNDRLDPEARRITLKDGQEEGGWLWAMDEIEPYQLLVEAEWIGEENRLFSNPDFMVFEEALLISNTAYFNVYVPFSDSVNKMDQLKNLLNEYKLLSKKYRIYEQTEF